MTDEKEAQLDKLRSLLASTATALFVFMLLTGALAGYTVGIAINRLFFSSYFATFIGFPQLGGAFIGACLAAFVGMMLRLTVVAASKDSSPNVDFLKNLSREFSLLMGKATEPVDTRSEEEREPQKTEGGDDAEAEESANDS
ncbi:MAG: hypothetical protein U5N86_07270 [Planctomycetota bacterium]|nr:hypothetical protein [Planctomycetota bacterium]